MLLPPPQHIEYGSNHVPLKRLAVVVPPDAATEERFAADQLMQQVLSHTGLKLERLQQSDGSHVPISLERTGSANPLPTPGEKSGPGSREAYRLKVSSAGILISSSSSAGIFYGVQTLCQLIQDEAGDYSFPEVQVEDWPSLAYRGTMVDMSEGPLATTDEVLRQLDFLARWKANQFYFYNEDSVELKGFPILNSQARFTENEVRRIIVYGRDRHIDVIPCLELYGHQHDLFRLEQYSDLADFAHGGEFDPSNNKAQGVIDNWISQYVKLFPSRFVHIGFDETWEISQAAVRAGSISTPAKLFLKQMNHVAGQFKASGRTVLAWGDIIVKYPEIVAQLPPGTIVTPWWYEPDPDPTYKRWLGALTVPGIERFVAPGVNGWSEITPDFEKSFRNIDTFLTAGIRANSIGLINTVWTDDQQCLHRMFWPGIAFGAAQPWHSIPISRDEFFTDYARLMYPESQAAKIGGAFADLARAQSLLEHALGRDTMDRLWRSPFTEEVLKELRSHKQDLSRSRLFVEQAQAVFEESAADSDNAVTLRPFVFGSHLLDYAAMRAQYAVEMDDLWNGISASHGSDEQLWDRFMATVSPGHGRVGDLMDALSLMVPEYRENWEAEYRPYRLQTAVQRWDKEYQFWLRFQSHLQRFHTAYRKGSPLPRLDDIAGEY